MTREEAKELFKKASDFAVHYFDHTDVVSLCQVDIILNEIFDEHETQLKDKNEEIERLINEVVILNNDLDRFISIERIKTRSIVAMLFWNAKKEKEKVIKADVSMAYGIALSSKDMFDKAYIMLKDNK